METEEFDSPQKTKVLVSQKNLPSVVGSPKQKSRKALHPRTPSGSQSSTSFNIFPNQIVNTPPAKRYQRVRNPFEAALAERLHLPLIASPSLFQRPSTPQMSSTQFEWTIEDVSSLKPAHLEPHDTQFVDSPDPDYEAKAQSAISSYFKEQQIVPSPVDCPLRSHRIMLSEMNGNTPIAKPGRRIRDCGTQTELSLPAVLPQALEDALRQYIQPHLASCSDESKPRFSSYTWSNFREPGDVDSKDTSLRRKLFDMHNVIVLDGEQHRVSVANSTTRHHNSSSASVGAAQRTAIVGKLSDSMDKSSFGSLSPISATDSLSISPSSPLSTKRKARLQNFLDFAEAERLSPIHPPARAPISGKSLKNAINAGISSELYRSSANEQTFGNLSHCGEANNSEKFTPERSSSPMHCLENTELSINKIFDIRISRVSGCCPRSGPVDPELFTHDDTEDMLDADEEEMQVSQLSAQSSICSSTSDTPRGKRRSASRKNLSQSFSAKWLDDDENNQVEVKQQPIKLPDSVANSDHDNLGVPNQRLLIHRTDSGFNEMTSSQTTHIDEYSCGSSQIQKPVMGLVCCSTPSKHSSGDF